MEVNKLVDDAGADACRELRTPVEIEEVDEFPPLDSLYVEKRAWKKINDVVVVSADLKSSTKPTSTSSPRHRPSCTKP